MIKNYVQGSLIQEKVTFKDFVTQLVIDPTTVICRVEKPDGTKTVYTYLSGADIVKVSTGIYYIWISLDQAGEWFVRFEGVGTAQSADQTPIQCVAARPS